MSINHLPTALRHNEGSARLLRIASKVATVVSAIGSVALLLYMGRRNKSIVLMVLFSIWVLAPFVESLLLNALITKRGSAVAQTALHVAMLIIAVASLALYAETVLRPPVSQPVFRFVLLPVVSNVLIIIVVVTAEVVSRLIHGRGTARSIGSN
jgi:hypothetical protein